MRTLRAMAVTGVSAVVLSLVPVGLASADSAVPPSGLATQVCDALPAPAASTAKQIDLSNTAVGLATTDLSAKSAALSTAVNTLVGAVVNYVNSSGGSASGRQLSAAAGAYADAMAAWSAAFDKLASTQKSALVLSSVTAPVLSGIKTGLSC